MTQAPVVQLLPPDALNGVRVGLSVSESADLPRLGLMETHFQLALGEIARCVLGASGELAYGGALRPDGYTLFLAQEVHRFSRPTQPLSVYLSWAEHRALGLSAIDTQRRAIGMFGKVICLDADGADVDATLGRSESPAPEMDPQVVERALTSLRRRMAAETMGRVLIGGRRSGYLGRMPGVVEEALLSIEKGQPIYLAGGFGGVTLDIIGALGIDDIGWLPVLTGSSDRGLSDGLQALAVAASGGLAANGLNADENRQLARTYRPSEIATLVSLGLGRLAGAISA